DRASAARRPNASRIRSAFGRSVWHDVASPCGSALTARAPRLRREEQSRAADGPNRAATAAATESHQSAEGPVEATNAVGRAGQQNAGLSRRSLASWFQSSLIADIEFLANFESKRR